MSRRDGKIIKYQGSLRVDGLSDRVSFEDALEAYRFAALMKHVTATSGSLTHREAFELFQGLLRSSLSRLAHVQWSDRLDELFYTSWRAAMLEAGALDSDLEALAYHQVCLIVDSTAHDWNERTRLFELVARYLVCTLASLPGKPRSLLRTKECR